MPTTSDLYDAIDSNDIGKVKQLIEDDEGLIYTHSYDYSTPLMHASECGYVEIVKYLLDCNYCDIDEGNDQTWYSPLIVAIENGHIEISKLLIENGADITRQYEKEIESDESYEKWQEQGYPLTLAIENGHHEIVKLLLEYGADLESVKWTFDGQWNSNKTPLILALQNNDFRLAELLIKYGANVDGECTLSGELCTPLSYSVAKKKQDWATFLLKNGADVKKEIEDGQTVLEYANSIGRVEMFNMNGVN